jgi:hypothetical protein
MTTKAIFTGLDSLGYVHGQTYTLEVIEPSWFQRLVHGWPPTWRVIITVPYFCPYSSQDKFRENWSVQNG